jgi:predicted nucleic acid-binding protein
MPASFIDSNVLLYLTWTDEPKRLRARALLARGDLHTSVQVLNELTNVARRKRRRPWPEIEEFLSFVRDFTAVHPLTVQTQAAGVPLAERHNFSVYDAQIVASALAAGCESLWSEDMQHGLVVEDRLTILNPFRE